MNFPERACTLSHNLVILPSKWLCSALVLYYGYSALSGYHLGFEMLTQRARLGFEMLMQRTYVTLPSKWLCSAPVLCYGHRALNGYHLGFEMLTQRDHLDFEMLTQRACMRKLFEANRTFLSLRVRLQYIHLR